jgi:hypothetical protein
MTRAEQAKSAFLREEMSWNELLNEASTIADAVDQDWENESTTFEYADGSVAVFDGKLQEILCYGSNN